MDIGSGSTDEEAISTAWMRLEQRALLGERMAIVQVISALRGYREACRNVLAQRHADGEVSAVTLFAFQQAVADIQETHCDEQSEE